VIRKPIKKYEAPAKAEELNLAAVITTEVAVASSIWFKQMQLWKLISITLA
jgi:hypothetical protein